MPEGQYGNRVVRKDIRIEGEQEGSTVQNTDQEYWSHLGASQKGGISGLPRLSESVLCAHWSLRSLGLEHWFSTCVAYQNFLGCFKKKMTDGRARALMEGIRSWKSGAQARFVLLGLIFCLFY